MATAAAQGDEDWLDGQLNLHYYRAVLSELPAAQPGQRALGVGQGKRVLAPALVSLCGYSEALWVENAAAPWPYDDASFDSLLLELTSDHEHSVAEAKRVLKSGGSLLIAAPNIASAKGVQSVLGGRAPYVQSTLREFTAAEIEKFATDAGFSVTTSRTEDLFWDPPEKVFSALAASGYPIGARGDTILVSARSAAHAKEAAQPAQPVAASRAGISVAASAPAPLRILVVHENLPRPDQSGAEYRFVQVLREMRAQGHSVTYLAPRGFEEQRYVPPLREIGVTVFTNDAQLLRREGHEVAPQWTLQEVLREGQFDLAFFYLWFWMSISIPEQYLDEIRRLSPRTRIAVLTDDCHGLREERGAALSGAWSDRERAVDYLERETEIFRRADVVLAVSDDDRKRLAKDSPGLEIELLPNVVEPARLGRPSTAEGLMYLADYNDPASLDGAEWFLKEVFPSLRAKKPGAKLYLVGTGLPAGLGAGQEDVVRVGFAPDLAVEFAKRRILVSPVRYGTGTKTKNLHALAHGVPVVTTRIGAEGMDLADGKTALLAETPEQFARAVVRLYSDAQLWAKLSRNGRAHILKQFPHERMAGHLRRFLDRARDARPQNYDAAHVWSVRLVRRAFSRTCDALSAAGASVASPACVRARGETAYRRGRPRRGTAPTTAHLQLRPSRVPRGVFFTAFSSVAESVEAAYRASAKEKGAAELRREASRYSASLFPVPAPLAAALAGSAPSSLPLRREAKPKKGMRSSTAPEFSVIVPTYNRRETLAECLEALNCQTLSHRRFEVVVVDDGGSDGSADFCAEFSARYDLRFLRQENAGAGAARRRGADQARGKYLLLFNDDTIAAPDLLTVHLDAQRKNAHQKVAVLGDFQYPPASRQRALTHFLSTEPFFIPSGHARSRDTLEERLLRGL